MCFNQPKQLLYLRLAYFSIHAYLLPVSYARWKKLTKFNDCRKHRPQRICLYLQDAVWCQSSQQMLVLFEPSFPFCQSPLFKVQVILVRKNMLMQRCSGCVGSLWQSPLSTTSSHHLFICVLAAVNVCWGKQHSMGQHFCKKLNHGKTSLVLKTDS